MAAPDLLAGCWTTAGDAVPLPGHHLSPLRLVDRIEAAARAGFTGVGILDVDLERYLRDADLVTLQQILDDQGMTWVELEFLGGWWTEGETRAQSDRWRRFLLEAAQALSAHHIKVAPDVYDTSTPDFGQMAAELRQLSREAAEHGTRLALEFMPFANIRSLSEALRLVREADHPAAGLCIDIWHVERSGTPLEDVAAIPLDLLVAVELDDADAEQVGDPYDDTVLRRRLPGRGDLHVQEFIRAIAQTGWQGPWGVEIIADDYRLRPLDEALEDVMRTTTEQLSLAGLADSR